MEEACPYDFIKYRLMVNEESGFKSQESESAVIPIIVGRTSAAIVMGRRLLDRGLFVTVFGYPVVPKAAPG